VRAAAELARRDLGRVLGRPPAFADVDVDVAIGPRAVPGAVSFLTGLGGEAAGEDDLVVSTLPSPELRAQGVADVIAGDRVASVAVLGGDGAALGDAGLEVVPVTTAGEVAAAEPEAVVLADPDAAAEQLVDLIDAGYSPGDHRFYLVTERADAALGLAIGDRPGVLEGVSVIQPGAEVDEELRLELLEVDRTLDDLVGIPEAHDAVVIAALAAEAAGTDDPEHLAAELVGVTRGRATCTSFRECRELLAGGADIAYVGLGGGYELGDDGTPTRSVFTVLQYGADNLLDGNRSEFVVATLEG
ncbi:MAG TPA: hypothetical protein VD926_12350, partial [Acidimicrobiales bacterium]|nr:hypothetical protein [Acidimicrobiales bacterium]